MGELRENHLGVKRRRKAGPAVGERLQAAHDSVVMAEEADRAKSGGADLEYANNASRDTIWQA